MPYVKRRPFFSGGLPAILIDQNKLIVAIGGVTALAAEIYTLSIVDLSDELYKELAILLALMVGVLECITGF